MSGSAHVSAPRGHVEFGHGHVVDVSLDHQIPQVSNQCSNTVAEASDIRWGCPESDGAHLRVHERGADLSTPLLPPVPPRRIELRTFGTGNLNLLRLGYAQTTETRGITRMSEVCTKVQGRTHRVHRGVHLDGGSNHAR